MFDGLKARIAGLKAAIAVDFDAKTQEISANKIITAFSEMKIAAEGAKIIGSLTFYIGLFSWCWNRVDYRNIDFETISAFVVAMTSLYAFLFIFIRIPYIIYHSPIAYGMTRSRITVFIVGIACGFICVCLVITMLNFFAEARIALFSGK